MQSDYDSDALTGLDRWLGQIMQGMSPAKRKRMATKLGQALRRSNLARIKDNVEPDGGAMEEKKSRLDRRGRVRKKAGGKMFPSLRYAKYWKVRAQTDMVEITPVGGAKLAKIHHFGLKGYVGKGPDGKRIIYKYPRRRLLGFGDGDDELAIDAAAQLLDQER